MGFRFEVLWFESQWGPTARELLTVFNHLQWLHFQWMFISTIFGRFEFLQLCYQWIFFTRRVKCRHQRTSFAESRDKWPRCKFNIKYCPSESMQINNLNARKTLTGIHLIKPPFFKGGNEWVAGDFIPLENLILLYEKLNLNESIASW